MAEQSTQSSAICKELPATILDTPCQWNYPRAPTPPMVESWTEKTTLGVTYQHNSHGMIRGSTSQEQDFGNHVGPWTAMAAKA
eukprot:4202048-Amphidinium_carterae.1